MKSIRYITVLLCCVVGLSMAQQTQKYIHDDVLFERGEEMLELSNYTQAQHFFQKYLDSKPKGVHYIDAEYQLGYCALHLAQDLDRGEKLLLEWKDKYPKHPKAVFVNVELGRYYYAKKKYKDAIKYYSQIDFSEIDKDDVDEINFELAYSYFMIRDLKNAERYFDKSKNKEHKYTYAANYYSGYIKFKKKDYTQSLTDFKKAGENTTYAKVVPFMIVNIFYQQGKDTEVIKYGEKVLAENKGGNKKKDVALLVAESHFNQGDYKKAYTYYGLSFGKNLSKDRVVNYKYGYSAFKSSEFTSAIKGFNQVTTEVDSLGQYAAYYLGQSYIKNGDKKSAIIAFTRASGINKNPKIQQEALYDLGRLSYEVGDYDGAIKVFKQYTDSSQVISKKARAEEFIANSYTKTNDLDQAIGYIESLPKQTTSIKETYQLVTLNKGIELFNKHKFRQANVYFTKSLKYPLNADNEISARYWRGECRSLARKWKEASWDYSELLSKSNKSNEYYVKANYGIAYTYFNRKEYKSAKKYFSNYINLDKNGVFYGNAMLRLADCYFEQKEYKQARGAYEDALSKDTKNRDYAYLQIGKVYRAEEKREKSFEYFDKLIANPQSPHYANALLQKGEMYVGESDYMNGKKVYSLFIKNAMNHPSYVDGLVMLATCKETLGEFEGATIDYEKIVNNHCEHTHSVNAISRLNDLYIKLNQSSKYTAVFEQYKKCADPKHIESINYTAAKKMFDNLEYVKAAELYETFIQEYPNSYKKTDAIYYAGLSYYSAASYEKASPYFEQLVSDVNGEYYAASILNLAQISKKTKDYTKALSYYEKSLKLTNHTTKLIVIYSDLTMINYELKDYSKAKKYAESILKYDNKLIWAHNYANIYLAKIAYETKDVSAKSKFKIIEQASDDEYAAEAHFYLSKLLYDSKEYQTSIDSCGAYVDTYSSHKKWMGESYLLMAENYVQLKEVGNAIIVLESLNAFPDEGIRKRALDRIKVLKEQETLNTSVDTSEILLEEEAIDINEEKEVEGE